MAGSRTRVHDRAGQRVDEGKIVAAISQGQFQDANRIGEPNLAVRGGWWRCLDYLGAAGADNELPDTSLRITRAIRRLRCKSLIDVLMAVQDELSIGLVEELPEALDLRAAPLGT